MQLWVIVFEVCKKPAIEIIASELYSVTFQQAQMTNLSSIHNRCLMDITQAH